MRVCVCASISSPAARPGQPAPRRRPGFSAHVAARRSGTAAHGAPGSGSSGARKPQRRTTSPRRARLELRPTPERNRPQPQPATASLFPRGSGSAAPAERSKVRVNGADCAGSVLGLNVTRSSCCETVSPSRIHGIVPRAPRCTKTSRQPGNQTQTSFILKSTRQDIIEA